MKINLYNLFTKVALLSAIVVATAFVSTQAQSLAYPITASIPFDFSVADTKLPAGKYSIARAKVSFDTRLELQCERQIHIDFPSLRGSVLPLPGVVRW
jgi:hypothetical protein